MAARQDQGNPDCAIGKCGASAASTITSRELPHSMLVGESYRRAEAVFWTAYGVVGKNRPQDALQVAMTKRNAVFCIVSLLLATHVGSAVLADPPGFQLAWGQFGSSPGQFHSPRGIAVASDGQVFVIDEINNRIQVFDDTGHFIRTWGSTSLADDGFLAPQGVVTDVLGHICVAQGDLTIVQSFTTEGAFLSAWHLGHSVSDLEHSGDGTLYVVASHDPYISRLDARTGASLGSFGGGGTGSAKLTHLWGIGRGSDGTLYVPDWGADNVKMYDADGTFKGVIGATGNGPGQFREPADVAVDAQGRIYVTDFGNDRVQAFNSAGQYLFEWGGYGLGPGELRLPTGIAVGPDGDIYVCDTGNHRVQRFSYTVSVQRTTWSLIKALYAPKGLP